MRWLRWHCPPDTGCEIRALAVWGRARYLSVTEAPHNTNFHTWMGKKHFCFFQTAETGNRTPDSGVKGSGANHYPRAPARVMGSLIGLAMDISRSSRWYGWAGYHGAITVAAALCSRITWTTWQKSEWWADPIVVDCPVPLTQCVHCTGLRVFEPAVVYRQSSGSWLCRRICPQCVGPTSRREPETASGTGCSCQSYLSSKRDK